MEKVEYSWESFYKEVASWKFFSSRTAEMFLNDDFVYKMYNSSMLLKRRKEANIDLIAGLDEKLLTIPDRKVYIDGVYQGFRMKNGGIPLLKYIIDNQVSFDGKIEILYKIKNIVKYLDELGLIHGDLRLPNFLIKDGIIRLTDLNNMILHAGDDADDIPDLHNDWYETLDTAFLLDNLAFNLLTYILLNYSNETIQLIITYGLNITNVGSIFNVDHELFDPDVTSVVRSAILFDDVAMKQLKPDTYLIDYLKKSIF